MKGHTRLLWNGCWCDSDQSVFFTVGRDKQLIVWKWDSVKWDKIASYSESEAITAIDSIGRVKNRLIVRLYNNLINQGVGYRILLISKSKRQKFRNDFDWFRIRKTRAFDLEQRNHREFRISR